MKLKHAIIVSIFLALIGCTSSTDSSEKSATQKFIQSEGVRYTLKIHQVNFAIDDSLKIEFEVKNISLNQKTFDFGNQQQFGFRLIDQFNQVAMFHPIIVQPATSSFILNPGEKKVFSFSGQFKDHEGNYIDNGKYRLSTYLLSNYPEVTLSITIE